MRVKVNLTLDFDHEYMICFFICFAQNLFFSLNEVINTSVSYRIFFTNEFNFAHPLIKCLIVFLTSVLRRKQFDTPHTKKNSTSSAFN